MDVQLVEDTISERMIEPLVLVLRQHYGPSRAVAAVVPLAGHAAFPALCGPYCLAALAFVDVLGARRPRRKPATRATFRGNAPGTRALDGVRRFGPLARRNSSLPETAFTSSRVPTYDRYSYGGTARQRGGVGFRPLHLPGGLRFNDAERQLIR
jgi:hypothetical protein